VCFCLVAAQCCRRCWTWIVTHRTQMKACWTTREGWLVNCHHLRQLLRPAAPHDAFASNVCATCDAHFTQSTRQTRTRAQADFVPHLSAFSFSGLRLAPSSALTSLSELVLSLSDPSSKFGRSGLGKPPPVAKNALSWSPHWYNDWSVKPFSVGGLSAWPAPINSLLRGVNPVSLVSCGPGALSPHTRNATHTQAAESPYLARFRHGLELVRNRLHGRPSVVPASPGEQLALI
jgi:hypothetical protein